MGYYRVLLRCELPDGFRIDGEPMSGFHTTRFVDASSEVAAGEAAIDALRRETKFRALRAQLTADLMITAEEVEPEKNRRADAPLAGFLFHSDE